MSSKFYKTIIEDEMKACDIKKKLLKIGAKSVSKTYSRKSLTEGQTFLDYSIPQNRCAYIFKYATMHTALVAKYFKKLVDKKNVKSVLRKKKALKICCLGGGPGTDVVGLFKALALFPCFHKKVVQVTILDICGGWIDSFERIISNVIDGKVSDIPETFINNANFKFQLIEVNLLHDLPIDIVRILSKADIVCMVKFVSAILGSPTSMSALKVIADKLKIGAVVFFLDNFQGSVFKPFVDISDEIGLQVAMGPLHAGLHHKTGSSHQRVTSNERKMFGCLPLVNAKITALGFIKLNNKCKTTTSNSPSVPSKQLTNNNDGVWETDEESENPAKEIRKGFFQCIPKTRFQKFTQTEEKYFENSYVHKNTCVETILTNELSSLINHLCNLVNVLGQLKEQMITANHCYHKH